MGANPHILHKSIGKMQFSRKIIKLNVRETLDERYRIFIHASTVEDFWLKMRRSIHINEMLSVFSCRFLSVVVLIITLLVVFMLHSIGSISALVIYLFESDTLIIVFVGAFVFGHIQSPIQREAIYIFGSHKINI